MKTCKKVVKRIALGLFLIVTVGLLLIWIWSAIETNREKKDLEQIGTSVVVDGLQLWTNSMGQGEKTMVLLSGMGTPSPIIDFEPLAKRLSKKYKVITIEYPGYGMSQDTKQEWTNEFVVRVIRHTLQQLDAKPPYILVPHSISGIYCMEYVKEYPEEIEAVIGLESSVPMQLYYESSEEKQEISDALYHLIRALDASGITRLVNSMQQDLFIQDMENSGNYTDEQMHLVKELYSRHSITKARLSECRNLYKNGEELYQVRFPSNMPVLFLLSKDSCDTFSEQQNDKGSQITWAGLRQDLFTNEKIQKISYLNGHHYLQWTEVDRIIEEIDHFLSEVK